MIPSRPALVVQASAVFNHFTAAFGFLLVASVGTHAAELTEAERALIAEHVRPCWQRSDAAISVDTRITLSIVTEVDGTAIDAASLVSSARFFAGVFGPAERALAEMAKRAALDPRCNPLPIPSRFLGHRQSFTVVFGP